MNKKLNYIHKDLANGRWREFPLIKQMANIGSEVFRTIKWKNHSDEKLSREAFERALELSDLTIDDPKNIVSLKEITRMREALVDYFMGDNEYGSSDKLWENYFLFFNFKARANH